MKNQDNLSPSAWARRGWSRQVTAHCIKRLCGLWPPLCLGLARLRQIVFRFDPESLEFLTGVLALNVGSWLASPSLRPGSLRPGQSEALLGRWGAHVWLVSLWGVAFVLVGVAQILALGRTRVRVRCLCAMSGFCLWASLFVLAVLDAVPGLGISLFPFIALSEAWVYLRLSLPWRHSRAPRSRAPRPPGSPGEMPASTSRVDIHP